jgi:hypothetical protein
VRIEEALPYVSAALAAGATWAAAVRPDTTLERLLKGAALLALAIFAFFRAAAADALAIALLLSALAQALPPAKERPPWATGSSLAALLAWAAFAWLFWREGVGQLAFSDPLRIGLMALAALAAAGALYGLHRSLGPAGPGAAIDLSVLLLMLGAAFTLPFGYWPAMAGAAAVAAGETMSLNRTFRETPATAADRVVQWLLSFAGVAAIAATFLR